MNIAVIPARGGSKRMPGKNLLELGGKPLIVWTIEAALGSGCFDEVVVSTDDPEIAAVARSIGATVPFIRPAEISTDTAASIDVVRHALSWFEAKGREYETVTLLQPTSPLRTAGHIREAFDQFVRKNANTVVSMCASEHPLEWYGELEADDSIDRFCSRQPFRRSQDYPLRYRLNGAIYITRRRIVAEYGSFFAPSGNFAYIMNAMDSIDIDTRVDFLIAESISEFRRRTAEPAATRGNEHLNDTGTQED